MECFLSGSFKEFAIGIVATLATAKEKEKLMKNGFVQNSPKSLKKN